MSLETMSLSEGHYGSATKTLNQTNQEESNTKQQNTKDQNTTTIHLETSDEKTQETAGDEMLAAVQHSMKANFLNIQEKKEDTSQ